MKTKEFDALIKSKFKENDFEYNPDNWDRMQWKLTNTGTSSNKRLWITVAVGLAASLTMLAAITGFYKYSGKKQSTAPVMVNNTHAPESHEATALPQKESTELLPDERTTEPIPQRTSQPVRHTAKPITAAVQVPETIAATLTSKEPAKTTDAPGKETIDLSKKTSPGRYNTLPGDNHVSDQPLYDTYTTIPPGKINFSLGGGYNYGSTGSGYMLSASAHKQVSNKLYLEGAVAFVNNGASTTTSTYAYNDGFFNSNSNSNPNSPGVTSGREEPIKVTSTSTLNLYYVQFTPVVGYQLHKKIRIGMGPDFQQLLQTRYTHVRDEGGHTYEIPGTDLGFIGKAEYALTSRIKTSLSYREGVNDVFNNGKNYFDRDYLQVQLNYTLNK